MQCASGAPPSLPGTFARDSPRCMRDGVDARECAAICGICRHGLGGANLDQRSERAELNRRQHSNVPTFLVSPVHVGAILYGPLSSLTSVNSV